MSKNGDLSTLAKIVAPVITTALLSAIGFLWIQDMKHKDEMAQLRLDHLSEFSQLSNEIALMRITLNGLKTQVEQMRFNGVGGQANETTRSDLLDFRSFYVATSLSFPYGL